MGEKTTTHIHTHNKSNELNRQGAILLQEQQNQTVSVLIEAAITKREEVVAR